MTSKNTRHMGTVVAMLLLTCMVTACHKTCTCYNYDGSEREYTAEEVKEMASNCDNMVFQAGTRFYSYCTW